MSGSLAASFEALMRSWPELAGFAGWESGPCELSSLSPDVARTRISQIAALASAASDPHDAELLRAQAELYSWSFDLGRWRRNPDVLSEWSALLLRKALLAASRPDEVSRLEDWLASIPKCLLGGREGREKPDPVALQQASAAAAGVLEQVQALAEYCSPSAIREATGALGKHIAWLNGLTPGPPLEGLGAESCAELLKRRGIKVGPWDLLARVKEDVSRARGALPADLDARRVAARGGAGDTFESVLAAFRALTEAASQAAAAAGLPDVHAPPVEVLRTPEALRPSIPGAAAFTARPLQSGETHLIVLTEDADLSGYSAARLANLAVHEGHPGHGLQAALANRAGRPWRAVDLCPIPGFGSGLFACELMEGWAHFAEERLAEAGFHGDTDGRFVQRDEALWRAVRARVDLGINLGELNEAAALSILVDDAGLSPSAALAEVTDYRLQPTYGLSYLWGKLELSRLRRAWRGPEPELYRALLSEGLVPFTLSARWLNLDGG